MLKSVPSGSDMSCSQRGMWTVFWPNWKRVRRAAETAERVMVNLTCACEGEGLAWGESEAGGAQVDGTGRTQER